MRRPADGLRPRMRRVRPPGRQLALRRYRRPTTYPASLALTPHELSSRAAAQMVTPLDSRPGSKRRVGCSCDANRLRRHVIDAGFDRGAPCRMGMWRIVPLPGPRTVGRLGRRFKHHAGAPGLPRSCRAPRLRRRLGCRRVATRSNGPTRWCARCRARAGWSRRSGRRRAHRIGLFRGPRRRTSTTSTSGTTGPCAFYSRVALCCPFAEIDVNQNRSGSPSTTGAPAAARDQDFAIRECREKRADIGLFNS